jgi:hypothetical protein
MKALIAGGAGHSGSHADVEFMTTGNGPVVVDIFSSSGRLGQGPTASGMICGPSTMPGAGSRTTCIGYKSSSFNQTPEIS